MKTILILLMSVLLLFVWLCVTEVRLHRKVMRNVLSQWMKSLEDAYAANTDAQRYRVMRENRKLIRAYWKAFGFKWDTIDDSKYRSDHNSGGNNIANVETGGGQFVNSMVNNNTYIKEK